MVGLDHVHGLNCVSLCRMPKCDVAGVRSHGTIGDFDEGVNDETETGRAGCEHLRDATLREGVLSVLPVRLLPSIALRIPRAQ